MHLPDAWGYVQFAPPEGAPVLRDPTCALRQAAMSIYYGQRAFHEQEGKYALNLDQLQVDRALVDLFEVHIETDASTDGYSVVCKDEHLSVRVTHDRLIKAEGLTRLQGSGK